MFIEEWKNRAALDAHVQSEHFQRLVPLIDAHKRADGVFTHLQSHEALLAGS